MRRYLARRLLLLVPVLLGVSVVVFMVLHLSPGDPAEIMLAPQATADDLSRLRTELGLDEPLPWQYARWLALVVRGDFGRSLWMRRLKATLLLTGTTLVLSRDRPGAAAGSRRGRISSPNERVARSRSTLPRRMIWWRP